MSNIKELKAKPKISRNQMLLDVIRSTKEVMNNNEDVVDYVLIAVTKNVPGYIINNTHNNERNPLATVGALEMAKVITLDSSFVTYQEDEE